MFVMTWKQTERSGAKALSLHLSPCTAHRQQCDEEGDDGGGEEGRADNHARIAGRGYAVEVIEKLRQRRGTSGRNGLHKGWV